MRLPFFALCFALSAFPLIAKQKVLKPDLRFQQKLSKNEMVLHALDRLTFGPRPGDAVRVSKLGVKKWIEQQLHPNAILESPALEEKLQPLETLRLSPLEVWRNYPVQQSILQSLNGRALPDDPVYRVTTLKYAAYFRLDPEAKAKAPLTALKPIPQIEDLLSADQISTLRKGKPDQKRQVLDIIPDDKLDEYLIAMGPQLRNQLQNIAPVPVRRRILMLNSPQQVLNYDLLTAKLDRAIYSNRQLAEVLTDFWYNHFNVYLDKGNDRFLVPSYERETIRPNVLGRFRDMLQAVAESPAMLYYLDNYQSVAPPKDLKPANKRAIRGLNENYARELLELHTLGVDGGYTQKDIIEVARCFTGWTIQEPKKGNVYWFNEKSHDKGEKTVLGVTIPAGGGKEDGLKVLDILAHHPSTAQFISRKLAQRFVADRPPQSLIDRMAKTFRDKDGDIREVLRTMFSSKEFWSKGAYHAKLKSPLEMIASAARATNADVDDPFALANQIAALGQPLYRKVEPTGYLNTSEEWLNSGALMSRMNFALNFAQNRVPGVKVKQAIEPDVDDIGRQLLFTSLTAPTREAINSAIDKQQATAKKKPAPVPPGMIAGLVIGSPDFQRR